MAGVADILTAGEVAKLTAIAALNSGLSNADDAARGILRMFINSEWPQLWDDDAPRPLIAEQRGERTKSEMAGIIAARKDG